MIRESKRIERDRWHGGELRVRFRGITQEQQVPSCDVNVIRPTLV